MSFPKTERLLAVDRPEPWVLRVLVALAAFALWIAWAILARLTLVETSRTARLETAAVVRTVDSPLPARIEAVRVVLDQRVEAGDVLVELDDEGRQHGLAETRARLAAVAARLAALGTELAAEQGLWQHLQERSDRERHEASARHEQAREAGRLEQAEAARSARLAADGLLATADHERATARASVSSSAATAAGAALERLESERAAEEQRSLARRARLQQDTEQLRGEQAALQAHLRQLEVDLARRTVRAPVAGRVGRLTDARGGAFVDEGARLAEIVPDAQVRVVGAFPQAALGRLAVGQPARVRLDAFPWAQYGQLRGRVSAIATEVQDGLLRVELQVEEAGGLPLRHGLTGVVEIETERLAPAAILLRAAGASVARPSDGVRAR